MMDENDRSHEDYRSLRHISRKEGSEDTAPIEVDSSAFFYRAAAGTAQHTASGPASPEAAAQRPQHTRTAQGPSARGWSRGSTFQVGVKFC